MHIVMLYNNKNYKINFMKQNVKKMGRNTLFVFSILFLAFLYSCEKDNELIVNPAPINIIEQSSELTKLLKETAQTSIEGSSCAKLQYGISFSKYNKQFQVVETKNVQSDEQLLDFLNDLNESLIVSVNYPVNLLISNDDAIAFEGNSTLTTKLRETPKKCEAKQDCTLDKLFNSFAECPMYITSYNETNAYENYKLIFDYNDDNFEVYVNEDFVYEGGFKLSEKSDEEFILTLNTNWEVLKGDWIVQNCNSFSSHDLINGDNKMHLEGCDYKEEDLFSCFEDYRDLEIADENRDGSEIYDLTEIYSACLISKVDKIGVTYHNTKVDAIDNVNAIEMPESYKLNLGQVTVYSRAINFDTDSYKINTIELGLYSPNCDIAETKSILRECPWKIVEFTRGGVDYTKDVEEWIMDFSFTSKMTYTSSETNEVINSEFTVSEDTGSSVLNLPFVSNNFEALAMEWALNSCLSSKLVFVPKNPLIQKGTLVIERICD